MKNCLALRKIARALSVPVTMLTVAAGTLVIAPAARAADPGTFTVLGQFSGTALYSELVQGTDGNLYGTTGGGGAYGYGTVFKITPAGVRTTLHNFTLADGYEPQTGLVQGTDGNFYGTTLLGGTNDVGVAFKVSPAGQYTLLHNFDDATGYHPRAALMQATDGNFYGTASEGGASVNGGQNGVVYRLTPASVYTDLHDFGYTEGSYPLCKLVQGADGNFYGTANQGGTDGDGTVFRMNFAGAVTVVHSLVASTDGLGPGAGVIFGNDNNLYGTTSESGPEDSAAGTVFQCTIGGGFRVLHTFTYGDGSAPAALIKGTDGNFYGTTSGGGPNGGSGTVFRITSGGTLTTLHTFTFQNSGTYEPNAALCQSTDGNLYGTTFMGSVIYHGEIFRLSTAGTNFTDFYTFPGTDPASAQSGLILGTDGNFYGVSYYGGDFGDGTVYRVTPAGVPTTLHSFNGADGTEPVGALVEGKDGAFYGTTQGGGNNGVNSGTVFKITAAGAFTSLHDFTYDEGYFPQAALIQAADGNFYGTTTAGGTNEAGSAFKMTPAGALNVIHQFALAVDGSNVDGPLLQDSAGNFYGTTYYGPGSATGSVFKLTATGTVTTLCAFTGDNGGYPHAGLVKGTNGNFYGTTEMGGPANGYGTVFEITSAGALTILHTFDFDDGYSPSAELTLLGDGYFYGTTSEGGTNDAGVIYRINPAGTDFELLHNFGTDEGGGPECKLVLGPNGYFYGTTNGGGATGNTDGTLFRYTLRSVLTSATTVLGKVGAAFRYQITATNNPTQFGANTLPPGLQLNTATGVISGTPTQAGSFVVKLGLTNGDGGATQSITIVISEVPPVVTSAATASGEVGVAFGYTITATNGPTSFGVQGLPAGLSVNTKTGVISGTPAATGTFTLTLNVYNAAGKGSATLMLTIQAKGTPLVTSASSATGKEGTAFSFQIAVTNNPTAYGVQGLPAGLTVNTKTGVISGTPQKAGTYKMTLNVYNTAGKGSAPFTLTVTN